MNDKEYLLELAGKLDDGADFFEEPEGIRWIQISDRLAKETADRLRVIAARLPEGARGKGCLTGS